jgi:hypothetical protein
MSMRKLVLLSLLLTSALHAQAPASKPPRVFQVSPALLAKIKQTQDPAILAAVRHDADKAVKLGPWSVMQKSMTPASGDKHDYMSLARYFWPNPNTPDHLPYIRKDGQSNPEIKTISDDDFKHSTNKYAHQLALAYYLTGDEKYAQHASLLLHTWFLDPATKMNPNLQFAQAIRGVNDGRGTGILDARDFVDACDAVGLLSGSKYWTPADDAAMHTWFDAYYTWLTTSPHGKDEAAAKNNHGSWYDVQATGIALFLGKNDDARKIVETAKTKRIAVQIQPDGKQPLELARTNSFGYTLFNFTALSCLSQLGDNVGVDLWHYTAPSGGSLKVEADYLAPYITQEKKWTDQNIGEMKFNDARLPLLIAVLHLKDQKYSAIALKLGTPDTNELILQYALPK